jgi:hypothetical protein
MADFSQQEHWIDGDELTSGKQQTCPDLINLLFNYRDPAVLIAGETYSERSAKVCAPA